MIHSTEGELKLIPMAELVKDPDYRRFLQTQPKLPPVAADKKMSERAPWVVYVQREVDGPWGKKSFWSYSKAFKFLSKALRLGVHDATINCPKVGFDPPSRFVRIKGKYIVGSDGVKRQKTKRVDWKPRLAAEDQEHHWCKYCRRPTVFKYYRRHKALNLAAIDSTIPRCCICGASARIALSYNDRMFRR